MEIRLPPHSVRVSDTASAFRARNWPGFDASLKQIHPRAGSRLGLAHNFETLVELMGGDLVERRGKSSVFSFAAIQIWPRPIADLIRLA